MSNGLWLQKEGQQTLKANHCQLKGLASKDSSCGLQPQCKPHNQRRLVLVKENVVFHISVMRKALKEQAN
jgi:hypothetical protein